MFTNSFLFILILTQVNLLTCNLLNESKKIIHHANSIQCYDSNATLARAGQIILYVVIYQIMLINQS